MNITPRIEDPAMREMAGIQYELKPSHRLLFEIKARAGLDQAIETISLKIRHKSKDI
jgi:hypothetical protein